MSLLRYVAMGERQCSSMWCLHSVP